MRLLLFPVVVAVGALGAATVLTIDHAATGQRAAPAAAIGGVSPAAGNAGQHAAGSHAVRSDDDDEMMTPSRPTVVSLRRSRVGPVLVDDAGMTLYVFSADQTGVSHCTGACARSWLPVRSHGGKPHSGAPLPAAMIGSILRADGTYQVTAWRRPLYHYVGDRKPGDLNGQGRTGFGGTWQAATAQDDK